MKDLTREHISNKKGNYISIHIILYTLTSHCRVYIYFIITIPCMQFTIATVYIHAVLISHYIF